MTVLTNPGIKDATQQEWKILEAVMAAYKAKGKVPLERSEVEDCIIRSGASKMKRANMPAYISNMAKHGWLDPTKVGIRTFYSPIMTYTIRVNGTIVYDKGGPIPPPKSEEGQPTGSFMVRAREVHTEEAEPDETQLHLVSDNDDNNDYEEEVGEGATEEPESGTAAEAEEAEEEASVPNAETAESSAPAPEEAAVGITESPGQALPAADTIPSETNPPTSGEAMSMFPLAEVDKLYSGLNARDAEDLKKIDADIAALVFIRDNYDNVANVISQIGGRALPSQATVNDRLNAMDVRRSSIIQLQEDRAKNLDWFKSNLDQINAGLAILDKNAE